MTDARSRTTLIARAPHLLLVALSLLGVGCHSNNNTYPGTPVLTMGSMMSSPNPEFSAYIIAIEPEYGGRQCQFRQDVPARSHLVVLCFLGGEIGCRRR